MTKQEAYRILGLTSGKSAEGGVTLSEIKTRYRSLMRLVHPDARRLPGNLILTAPAKSSTPTHF